MESTKHCLSCTQPTLRKDIAQIKLLHKILEGNETRIITVTPDCILIEKPVLYNCLSNLLCTKLTYFI